MTSSSHLIQAAGMVAESIIKPLTPKGDSWRQLPLPPSVRGQGALMMRFQHRAGYNVLSAVEMVEEERGSKPALHYHISITKYLHGEVGRCPSQEALHLLKSFELDGWEEDNHVPHGLVRNYWRPVVDNDVGKECPCKDAEPVIREMKGNYIWRPAPEDH